MRHSFVHIHGPRDTNDHSASVRNENGDAMAQCYV